MAEVQATLSGCHYHCLCGKKKGLPANPNVPGSLSHQHLGVTSHGDGGLENSCACTTCPGAVYPSIGTKSRSGWSGRGLIDRPCCSLPLTGSHREHCHTNRKDWRAENTEVLGVVGRKSELLSITLCELLTGLRSQASVLTEDALKGQCGGTFSWWNSILNAGERGTLAIQKEIVSFFGEPRLMELLLMLLAFHGQFVSGPQLLVDDYVQSMPGWFRRWFVKYLRLVLEDQSTLRHK